MPPILAPLAAALAAAGLLGGCAGLGEPYARPQLELPAGWAGQAPGAAGWPEKDWWRRFGSAELDDLVAQAQAGNRELKGAAARVAQARALARIAGASLYPTLGADVGASRSKVSGVPAANAYAASLAAAYELDLWGGQRAARAAAEAGVEASRHAEAALKLVVTAEVASAYFQLLALDEQLEAARANLDNARRLLELVERQGRAGRASALELARQRGLLAGTEAAIPPLLQQRRAALDALAVLLGRNPESLTVAGGVLRTLTFPEVPAGLPAELIERRPDIRQAEAALAAAHADLAAARAALLPRLPLSLRAGSAAASAGGLFGAGSGFAAIGLDLLATIFDGGRLSGQVELSAARRQELVENYRQAVLNALRDVEDALAGVEQFAAQEGAQQRALAQAREALRLVELRYRAGGVDYLAVLDAQRTQIAAGEAVTVARYLRLGSLVGLYRALGGGWEAAAP